MGLIAWYPLDGDARDAVGDRHGEIVGSVNWTDGKLGKAASTEYGRHYIRVPHDPELSAKIFGVVPKVTLAAWVKLRSYNNYGLIVGKNSGGSFSNTTNAIWVTSSHVRFVVGSNESSNPSGSTAYVYAGSSFTLNTWHHVAAVLDGDWMGIYVDGVLVDFGSSVLARERSENTDDMVIGGPRTGGNEGVDGEIQDVRIYDHALSPREVRDLSLGLISHYPLTEDTLDAAGKNHASNYGALPTQEGHDFNGTDSRVTVPVFAGAGKGPDITLSAWCKPRAEGWVRVVQLGEHNHAQLDLSSSGVYRLLVSDTEAYGSHHTVADPDSQLNKWSHVCGVVSGGNFRLYVDGRLTGERTFPGLSVLENPTLSIGHDDRNSINNLDGVIRDVRIYATALTSSQVKELYQQKASIDSEGSVYSSPAEVIAGIGPVGLQHVNASSMDGTYFNGHDSYAYYEDVTGDLQVQEISVSVWLDLKSVGAWTPILMLGEKLNSPSDPRDWGHAAYCMWLNYSGLQVMLRGSSSRSPTNPVPLNRWVNLGFTYDGQRLKVFLDGVKVSDEADSGGLTYAGGARRILQLAGRNSYVWLNGGIRDVAVVGRAVSEAEFLAGLGPETNDLITWLPMRDDTASINSRGRLGKSVSEVGITRGLVAWYPLGSDTKDYAGTNHAVNNGAVLTAEGYEFGSSAYMQAAASVLPSSGDGVEATISALIMPENFSGEGWIVSQYASGGDLRFIWNTSSSGRMRYFIGGSSIAGTSALTTNIWVHVCVTRKADGTINLFLNGQPDGSGTMTALYADTPLIIGNSAGGSGASLTIRDVRIHNVALTPEEVAIQAKLALNQKTRVLMTENCLYTTGQIKEVIA